MTKDDLILAIRNAESLDELKRLVGPTDEENQVAKIRIEKIKSLWDKAEAMEWGHDPKSWPYPYCDIFIVFDTKQSAFENLYC